MMSKSKTKGSFAKILRLASVLQKCNGKLTIGDSDALISPKAAKVLAYVGLLLLTGALFTGFWFLEPVIAPFIPVPNIVKTVMLALMLLSFILAVKNIVTVLYTADDLPVLLPMPFSASQIVGAKLMVSSRFPLLISLVVMNAVGLGLGIRAGMGASFIIGTVLSSVLVPLTAIAAATLLVVIVFRMFGFIRNRDITMAFGGIFTLLLLVAYLFINNKLQHSDSTGTAAALTGIAALSDGFLNISCMCRFLFEGDAAGLLISVGITAVIALAALLAVKRFYLTTALSMQNTGSKNKAVNQGDLSSKKKSGALRALTTYEARSARRNPAYIVYGFAMSFIWPLFMIVPFLSNSSITDNLRFPLNTMSALACALLLGITASCFACGFNVLPVSAFSREGKSFGILRSMPIDFSDYYRSKRNFAMLICSLGSVGYILILGIVCAAAGFVAVESCWVFLYAAGISFLLNTVLVNLLLLKNSRKPNLSWDTETEISRKLSWVNTVFAIFGVLAMLFTILCAFFLPVLGTDKMPADGGTVSAIIIAICAAFAVLLPVSAFFLNRFCIRKAHRNIAALE